MNDLSRAQPGHTVSGGVPEQGRVAVVGTGTIGASWAVQFLAAGLDVVATDPAPGAEKRLWSEVLAHWPHLQRGAVAAGASIDRLTFTPDLTEAVADADFVQESGPEREAVKHEVFSVLDAATGPDVVLASSSSFIRPSVIAAACEKNPERVIVGHPFNPPHLIPLVEVVPAKNTAEASVERAMAFYRGVGKRPIRLRRELAGHVANRLQGALWREACWLVEQGVATVADIDTAISCGPGLRWAVLGPFANMHLSGGPGGIAHVLAHLGPGMEQIWQDLHAVTLTPELKALLVSGIDEELSGIDPGELGLRRDAVVNALLAEKSRAQLSDNGEDRR
jgi:carnitine 3-dehydrogenase